MKIKAKFKTEEQFLKEGFVKEWAKIVRKEKKPFFKFEVSYTILENLAGKEIEIVEVINPESGYLQAHYQGRNYRVFQWMLEQPIKYPKIKPKKEKIPMPDVIKKLQLLGKNGDIEYNCTSKKFDFDCSFSELTRAQAKKVARWVLKVAK